MEDILFNIQNYISGAGIWGPIVYILAMVIAIVIAPIPSSPLAIFAGNVFGVWFGMLLTMIGATLGATIAFYIARFFGRPIVVKFVSKEKLEKVEHYFSERNLVFAIFLLRLVPLPFFDAVSYAAGLTHVSFRGFALSTVFGLVPLVFLFSYTGDVFTENIVAVSIIIILVSIILPVLVPFLYKNSIGRIPRD